ncbi:hypothetical protein AKO1_006117 [Acrasis kona]|uniref:Presequence translocated-associated motor subunit PAM16 n=1 Tax=Acrasis kona TaxID=1008807 RepID=A0AAW2YHH8_9EUKA
MVLPFGPIIKAAIRIGLVAGPILIKSFRTAYDQAAMGSATRMATEKLNVNRVAPMTKEEAIRILGVEEEIDNEEFDYDLTIQNFERMFKNNAPENGGSFYLQSKIYRAKECLEEELSKEGRIDNERVSKWRKITDSVISRQTTQEPEQEPKSI